jgi:hypothetical protein
MWQKMKKILFGKRRLTELSSGAIKRTFSGDIEVVSWASTTEELPIAPPTFEDEITAPGVFLPSEDKKI